MAFLSTFTGWPKGFTGSEIKRAGGRAVMKTARDFRDQTRRKMVESVPTGKVYERGAGRGFRHSHRASKRGQRPAVETGNLANRALKAERASDTSAVTFVDPDIAPYGERLQDKLDRPIISQADERTAEIQFEYNLEQEFEKLLK